MTISGARFSIFGLLLLTAVLLPSTADAASKDTLQAVQDATVNIYCTYKSGNKLYSSTGSGVFIDSRGVILTNAHVVVPYLVTDKKGTQASTCTIRTGSPARDRYTASILYVSPAWMEANVEALRKRDKGGTGVGDAALLYVTEATEGELPATFPALSFDAAPILSVAEGEEVVAAGFPAGDKSFKQIRSRLAYVAAEPEITSIRSYVRPYSDVLMLSGSEAGSSGVSGGPVARADGQLIAIANAADTKSKEGERVLRAITLSHIDRFILAETGSSLTTMLAGDLALRAQITNLLLSADLKKDITSALLRKR